MIKDANNIFNSISSSGVCNEVIRSEQATEYVQGKGTIKCLTFSRKEHNETNSITQGT